MTERDTDSSAAIVKALALVIIAVCAVSTTITMVLIAATMERMESDIGGMSHGVRAVADAVKGPDTEGAEARSWSLATAWTDSNGEHSITTERDIANNESVRDWMARHQEAVDKERSK